MGLIRSLLFDNLGLKLVALLLALAVYLHVFTERTATMVVAFPVQITNLPDSLALGGAVPADVSAELQGTGKQFIRLWLTEPRLEVSLAGAEPGRLHRIVTADDLPLIESDRLTVRRMIGPDTLDLQIEPKLTRTLPVAPRVELAIQHDTAWSGAARAEPPVAVVSGPRRAIAALDSVRLEPIRLGTGRDSAKVGVHPAELPPGASIEPESFRVVGIR
jgi:hypothetical protein